MLLAGAAQHMALKKKTPGGLGVSPGVGSASHLGGHRRWLGTGDVPRIRAYPDSLEPERAVDKPVDSLWMIGPPVLTPGANGSSGGLPDQTTPCRTGRADTSPAPATCDPVGGGRLLKRQRPRSVTPRPPSFQSHAIQTRFLPLNISSPVIVVHWRQTSLIRSVPRVAMRYGMASP